MTIAVPVTLTELRAALIERTQLGANDPRAANTALDPIINAAMHRFQVADPNGWPWDFTEAEVTLTIGVDDVFAGIDGALPGFLTKVRYCVLRHPAGLWEYPLERVTRSDQLDRFPTDNEGGPPRTFSLLGYYAAIANEPGLRIKLRPEPDLAYKLLIGGQFPGEDLVAGTDPDPALNDHMIGEWSDAMLDYAASLVYRSHADLLEASIAALDGFDDAVLTLRRSARTTVGPGIGGNPLVDDLNSP